MTDERVAFEAWASSPPMEFDLTRFPETGAWPGVYTRYHVHCAWDAWQARAALEAAA